MYIVIKQYCHPKCRAIYKTWFRQIMNQHQLVFRCSNNKVINNEAFQLKLNFCEYKVTLCILQNCFRYILKHSCFSRIIIDFHVLAYEFLIDHRSLVSLILRRNIIKIEKYIQPITMFSFAIMFLLHLQIHIYLEFLTTRIKYLDSLSVLLQKPFDLNI